MSRLTGLLRLAGIMLFGTGLVFLTQPARAASGDSTPAWQLAQSNPAELMRQAFSNELANSYGHRSPVRYRLRKVNAKSDTTKIIVETTDGGVARLTAVGGQPLSPLQTQQEIDRLQTLLSDPSLEVHRQKSEMGDAERVQKMMRLLPTAFLYQSAGSAEAADGRMIRLTFEPNPKFSPPDFESRLLTGIRGEIWIAPEDLRVVRVQGRVFRPVDFGWGVLGSLYPGATIQIDQSKTPTCGWQLAHLGLHFRGKALIFKTLRVDVEETASDYEPVPRGWNYKDAVRWLLQNSDTGPQAAN
jgi:hypothetical protein